MDTGPWDRSGQASEFYRTILLSRLAGECAEQTIGSDQIDPDRFDAESEESNLDRFRNIFCGRFEASRFMFASNQSSAPHADRQTGFNWMRTMTTEKFHKQ